MLWMSTEWGKREWKSTMYKIHSKAKQIPCQSQLSMLLQTWLYLASRLGTIESFDSSLPLTIFYIPLVPKTFHVFSSGTGSLTLAFLLSPHYLVLITLLLQVASWLYLGISCTSYRKLENAREGRERWGSGSKSAHRRAWPSWWGWQRRFRMPEAVRNPRVTKMTTFQISGQANRAMGCVLPNRVK